MSHKEWHMLKSEKTSYAYIKSKITTISTNTMKYILKTEMDSLIF